MNTRLCSSCALALVLLACVGDAPPVTPDDPDHQADESPVQGDGDARDGSADQDEGVEDSDPDDDEGSDDPPSHDGGSGDGDTSGDGDGDDLPCAVDPARIYEDVAYLASAELRGRIPGDIGNERALTFAEQEMTLAGLSGGGVGGSFRQPFEFSCDHDWCRDHSFGSTENVMGKITGSDPELAQEVILVGAHIDHLGVDDDGAVYGGADDNASGAAIVLELARMFERCRLKPRRTVMFVEWNAEEMGLIGSRHYVDQPTLPLEQTIAAYNFDMVGSGDGSGVLLFGGDDSENRWLTDLMMNAAAAEGLEHVIELVPQKLASDHAPFVERGVPVCWGFARPDPHPGYHTPDDDISRINPQSLRAVSELFWAALRPLAMGEEAKFTHRSRSRPTRRPTLPAASVPDQSHCGAVR